MDNPKIDKKMMLQAFITKLQMSGELQNISQELNLV
jgi:hypothetical protein